MEQYGGAKKPNKKTTTIKAKKVSTTSSRKTTKNRSKAKGGNFLGAIGDLVAPTGWGPFASAAGLLALDRADAALRRKAKKVKMNGGECESIPLSNKTLFINNLKENDANNLKETEILKNYNFNNPKFISNNPQITINCLEQNKYQISLQIFCNSEFITYNFNEIFYNSLQDAKEWLLKRNNQIILIGLALNSFHDKCKNPNYLTAWQRSQLPKLPDNSGPTLYPKPNAQRKGLLRTSKFQHMPISSTFPIPS